MASVERKHRPKKRKKKFITKQLNQAKRGRYGRGSEIGEDNFNYFLHVLRVKMDDFSSSEDKDIFIDNIFEQTAGKEMLISCNQLGSVVMEKFLPLTNDKILLRFTYAFSLDLRKMCCDEFGSHVLQQLIIVVTKHIMKNEFGEVEKGVSTSKMKKEEDEERHTESNEESNEEGNESQSANPEMIMRFKNWLQQFSKYVANNFEEFVMHRYANYIVRTLFECLSGLPPGSTPKGNKKETSFKNCPPIDSSATYLKPIPDAHDIVKGFGKRLYKMPRFVDFPYAASTSALLQTALRSLILIDESRSDKLFKSLLNLCYDSTLEDIKPACDQKFSENVSISFMNEYATRLMDVMINISSDMWFSQIYIRCFKGRLKVLSLAPNVNFCVQNLIKRCSDKVEFESIFEELSSNFEALVNNQKHGVLLALAEACQRLQTSQNQFVKELQSALHCTDKESQGVFPLLVAQMINHETWCQYREEDNKEFVKQQGSQLQLSLLGSLILQAMLNYPVTSKIVKCFLNMDSKDLREMFSDRIGSHIADAFFTSKTVVDKYRDKLVHKLQGTYVSLVLSKHGSRALDAIWNWSSLKHRKLILEEMSPHDVVIRSKMWGSIFSEKSGLSLFKRRPKDWEEVQKRDVRKHQLFADIIS